MSLGRHQLLEWINQVSQCEYTSVEMLSDGVAYAQVLDAIHPGCVALTKINMQTRSPDQCVRNMKIIEDALKKLQIGQPVLIERIGRGTFQGNIVFLQWLHNYALKWADRLTEYRAYDRRVAILKKQGKGDYPVDQFMSPHLIPNEVYLQQWDAGQGYAEEDQVEEVEQADQVQQRTRQMQAFVRSLQTDLKEKMEHNWRLMGMIQKSIEERNSLYSLLQHIEKIVLEAPAGVVRENITQMLGQIPEGFQ